MELLSPAGNLEKLKVAIHYGADALYIGGGAFNLRAKADNFSVDEIKEAVTYAHERNTKVYLTLNASLHEKDIENLKNYLEEIASIEIDAFIIADIGVLSIVKEMIPNANIHISTQANTTNSASVNFYKSMGVKRVVCARELTLNEIKQIKEKTGVELEIFAHGAMCIAYSGRCLLSNYLTARDANKGDCPQVCRWDFRLLEERSRKGEYFPVIESDKYTTILSSKDIVMANHLNKVLDAGVDSLKIEGRIKSVYYTAQITRVYRVLLDMLSEDRENFCENINKEPYKSYLEELNTVSRRQSGSGFYFRDEEEDSIKPTLSSYLEGRRLAAMVLEKQGELAKLKIYNSLKKGETYTAIGKEYISKEILADEMFIKTDDGSLVKADSLRNVDEAYIKSDFLSEFDIICSNNGFHSR